MLYLVRCWSECSVKKNIVFLTSSVLQEDTDAERGLFCSRRVSFLPVVCSAREAHDGSSFFLPLDSLIFAFEWTDVASSTCTEAVILQSRVVYVLEMHTFRGSVSQRVTFSIRNNKSGFKVSHFELCSPPDVGP